eukprot:365172-Chlamydomonas_euryale.AAC.7
MHAPPQSLESEIRDFASERGVRLKAAKERLRRAKAETEASRKLLKAAEAKAAALAAEAEGADAEAADLSTKAAAAEHAVCALATELAALRHAADAATADHAAARAALDAVRARLRECDAEISGHERARKRLLKTAGDLEADARRSEARAAASAKRADEAVRHCAALEKQYTWLLQVCARRWAVHRGRLAVCVYWLITAGDTEPVAQGGDTKPLAQGGDAEPVVQGGDTDQLCRVGNDAEWLNVGTSRVGRGRQ